MQLRQPVTDTTVDAEAKGSVLAWPRAVDDELIGVGNGVLVAIAREVPHHDLVAFLDLLVTEFGVGHCAGAGRRCR